jgi:hypothetical protein
MKFDVVTNNLLNLYKESVYITPRPELKRTLSTKKGSGLTEAEKEQANKVISQKTQEFKRNPKDASILLDLFNTIREFPDDDVINGKFTKQEYLNGLLGIAKKAGKDYGLVLKSELGGESKTIDEWKAKHGEADKPYYYALKAIIDYMGGMTKERSIKQVSDSTVELYYFDAEGNPWRTYVSVSDGKVGPSVLSQPPLNRKMYALTGMNMTEHPPVYIIDGEEMPPRWKPPELRGQDVLFVRDALNSDQAEKEFKKLYPSEIKGVSTGTYGMGGRKGSTTKRPAA